MLREEGMSMTSCRVHRRMSCVLREKGMRVTGRWVHRILPYVEVNGVIHGTWYTRKVSQILRWHAE